MCVTKSKRDTLFIKYNRNFPCFLKLFVVGSLQETQSTFSPGPLTGVKNHLFPLSLSFQHGFMENVLQPP